MLGTRFILSLCIVPLLPSCPSRCDDDDRACLTDQQLDNPVRNMPFWQEAFARPPEDRIAIAPPVLTEYISLANKKNGYPQRPIPAIPDVAFLQDVREAYSEIPSNVRNLLGQKLAGIYLIHNLGGSAYTDYIYDPDGNPVAAFIVLDAKVLGDKTANEWASWKEETPFQTDDRVRIETTIADAHSNNRKSTIQFLLLHEIGHVVSISAHVHPRWDLEVPEIKDAQKYEFFASSWIVGAKDFSSLFDKSYFPERSNVVYYFGAKLPKSEAVNIYSHLEKTNFPTLYATTNAFDDWGDSFGTYVHSVVMKKPFKITITKDGKIEKVFELCWGTPRCAAKERIIRGILQNAS
ncbi:MAG: hypothetical protein AB7T49_09140 [Oligoflexales bacterium]